MKVIHIESGLGNQMLSYCELLSLKHVNPLEEFYLETLVYDIPEAAEVISQWQGYELQRVFDIQTPNIRDKFTEKQWGAIIEERENFGRKIGIGLFILQMLLNGRG